MTFDVASESTTDAILIDPEFRALIPPLSAEERNQLTENLRAEGCRDALIVWRGLLADGHNRFEICTEHDIPYSVRTLDGCESRDDVKRWIIRNQLGRRNLSAFARAELALALEPLIRTKARENQGARTDLSPNLAESSPIDTRAEVAEVAAVSNGTLDKVKLIAEQAPEEVKALLRSGARVTDADKARVIAACAPAPIVEALREGKKLSIDGVYSKLVKSNEIAEAKASFANLAKSGDATQGIVHWTDAGIFVRSIEAASADLLLTDPPYMTDIDDIHAFARTWLPFALSRLKPSGRAYICIGAYPDELLAYLSAPRAGFELAQVLVWTYRNTLGPSPSHDYKLNWQAILYFRGPDAAPLDCPLMVEQFSVQDISAPDGRQAARFHEWQKPDEIAERFIRHATKPGDMVIDPFAGTGAFVAAAARLGRVGRGADIDEDALDLCRKRGLRVEGPF